MAFPSTLLSLLHAAPGNFLSAWFGGVVAHSDGDNLIIDDLIAVETELGLTPAAATALGFTRLGDADGSGLWVPTASIGGPSLIVNGNMDHWQRTVGASVTSTTTYSTVTNYCADRIFVLPGGASVAQARGGIVPNGSRYSLQVTGAASVTTVDIGQRIRSDQVQRRGFRSLVFSAYLYNNTGAAFTPNLRIGTPSVVDNFATVTNRLDVSLQSCPDALFTRVYYVVDPSAYTNLANGLECVLRVPSGVLVAGKIVYVAQFDLRPGTHLVGYVPPQEDLELLLCRQHYRTNLPVTAAPLTNGVAQLYAVEGASIANNAYYATVPLSPPMWQTPSAAAFPNTTGANFGRSSNDAGVDYAAGSATATGVTASQVPIKNVSGGALTVGATQVVQFGLVVNAEL